MNFGRQTGATYWMTNKIDTLRSAGYQCLIGSLNHDTIMRLKKESFPDFRLTPNSLDPSLAFFNYDTDSAQNTKMFCKPLTYDFIFIDMSDFISDFKLDLIYEFFKGTIIVLL